MLSDCQVQISEFKVQSSEQEEKTLCISNTDRVQWSMRFIQIDYTRRRVTIFTKNCTKMISSLKTECRNVTNGKSLPNHQISMATGNEA
jgi:hypothetical protein